MLTLYIGCYTDNNPGIYKGEFTPSTRQLTVTPLQQDTPNPSFILQQGDILYASNEVEQQAMLSSFRLTGDSLEHLSTVEHEGSVCCHVAATQKMIYGSNYGSGSVVGAAHKEGKLAPISVHQVHEKNGVIARAHSSLVSPDGNYLLVADLGVNRVYSYQIKSDGDLTPAEQPFVTLPGGSGPRHMAFHPSGEFVYVVTEYSNALYTYSYFPETGRLEQRSALVLPVPAHPETAGADIHMHPSGRFLLASLRGPNALAVCQVEKDGMLSLVDLYSVGGNWPRNFAISPDGEYIFVANQLSDEITVLPFHQANGTIGKVIARCEVPTPACVIVAE